MRLIYLLQFLSNMNGKSFEILKILQIVTEYFFHYLM